MRRRTLASITAALAIATGGAAIAAETASAKAVLKTRVQLIYALLESDGRYKIHGDVLSKSYACRSGRTVRLHVVHADNTTTIADVTKSKSGGLYYVYAALAQSEGFFVTVAARDARVESGKRLHCGTGRSTPVFPVPPGGSFAR